MLNTLLPSTSTLAFPLPVNFGSLHQLMPDTTSIVLAFSGAGSAPGTSRFDIQFSVGGSGPWVDDSSLAYTLNGTTIPSATFHPISSYSKNNYFRGHWVNSTLGYTGPYTVFAGPTTKNRWDVTVPPAAPTSITSINFDGGPSTWTGYVYVKHSLLETADFSDTGILVSISYTVNNGGPNFTKTTTKYFSGWGTSTSVPQEYAIPIYDSVNTVVNVFGASAQYLVLGNSPGIAGTLINY